MRNKDIIDNVIELNGSYEIRIPFQNCVVGWGNTQFPTAHILVFKKENEYNINIYNTNEEGKVYSPHREYKYTIKKDGIYLTYSDRDTISISDIIYISTPFGWSDEMKDILREILSLLQS